MRCTIDSKKGLIFKIVPENTVEEVLQNVFMILSTLENEVPLSRKFGMSGEYYGKPLPIVETLLFADICQLLEKYEPRAVPVDITISEDPMTAAINYILELEVNEDEVS